MQQQCKIRILHSVYVQDILYKPSNTHYQCNTTDKQTDTHTHSDPYSQAACRSDSQAEIDVGAALLCPQCDPSPLKVKSGLCLQGNRGDRIDQPPPVRHTIQAAASPFVSQSEYHILTRTMEWVRVMLPLLSVSSTTPHTLLPSPNRQTHHTHTTPVGLSVSLTSAT